MSRLSPQSPIWPFVSTSWAPSSSENPNNLKYYHCVAFTFVSRSIAIVLPLQADGCDCMARTIDMLCV